MSAESNNGSAAVASEVVSTPTDLGLNSLSPVPAIGLSDKARDFVSRMQSSHTFTDAASVEMLHRMARILDELDETAAVLAANGPFYFDKWRQPKTHPAALREVALINEFGKLFRLLGLDQEPRGEKQGKLF